MPVAYFVIFLQCQHVEGSGLQARYFQCPEVLLAKELTEVERYEKKVMDGFKVHAESAG
jgi:hypothetical protein